MRLATAPVWLFVAACQPTFSALPDEASDQDAGIKKRDATTTGEADAGVNEPADAAAANVGWIAATSEGPEGRDRHVIVYSPKARAVILTGGGRAAPGDLWTWNGYAWERQPDPTFERKVDAAAAEDANGDIVLFGGRFETDAPPSNETWTWDGATWTRRAPVNTPRARIFSAMAYDRQRKKSVLFGGIGSTDDDVLQDTWEWDGENWTEITPDNSPAPRGYSAMTYDPEREKIVLFGGGTNEHLNGTRYGDLWGWDGENWEEITALFQGPSDRCDHAMAYDLERRAIVIFSGSNYWPFKRDTWELRDGRWWQISGGAEPVGVSNARMDYDRAGRRMVMFGGWNNGGHEHITYLLAPLE